MPEGLPDLEAAIRAAGEVCFLDGKSPAREPVELETIAARPATTTPGPRTLFIARRPLRVGHSAQRLG